MPPATVTARIETAESSFLLITAGENGRIDGLEARFFVEKKEGGLIYRLVLYPTRPVTLQRIRLRFPFPSGEVASFFCNGFQSWSESREFFPGEKIPNLRRIARPLLGYYGDYHISPPRRRNTLHSWTYGYLRMADDALHLFGSLEEASGFTLLRYDSSKRVTWVEKDCAGLRITEAYSALSLWVGSGSDTVVYDAWFSAMDCPPPRAAPAGGWTSWYYHYTDISEEKILRNLTAMQKAPFAVDFFQIDDGYQRRVGDWLDIKGAFPNGMASLAGAVRQAGFRPGLWLAPFICEKRSRLYRDHPDWLLRDARGRAIRAGYNPLWSGWYYALDVYHPGVRAYLERVFRTVLDEWGFELLKLDFLFAGCLLPRPDRSRGQVMYEALQFLRRLAGDRLLLGCGVPLGSAFGLMDYCRTGPDVHLHWEHGLLRWLGHRERVSTLLALRTVLGRWALNGRAFQSDPDVFLLREEKQYLSRTQRRTLLLINVLAGHLLFTSDDLARYEPWQQDVLRECLRWRNSRIEGVRTVAPDQYLILFQNEGRHWRALVNLTDRTARFGELPKAVTLAAFETRILPGPI